MNANNANNANDANNNNNEDVWVVPMERFGRNADFSNKTNTSWTRKSAPRPLIPQTKVAFAPTFSRGTLKGGNNNSNDEIHPELTNANTWGLWTIPDSHFHDLRTKEGEITAKNNDLRWANRPLPPRPLPPLPAATPNVLPASGGRKQTKRKHRKSVKRAIKNTRKH